MLKRSQTTPIAQITTPKNLLAFELFELLDLEEIFCMFLKRSYLASVQLFRFYILLDENQSFNISASAQEVVDLLL